MATLRLVPEDGGKAHDIAEDSLVGRDAACDVVVPHGSVSRRHARLVQREGGWAVVDQASANGTFLDGQRVADVGLRHGHVLRFGAVGFRVEVEGEPEHDGARTVAADAFPEHLIPQEARHIGLPDTPPPASQPSAPAPAPRPSAPPPPPGAAPPRPHGGGPAGGAMPAPPRKGRGALFWVAGGCLGCLGVVVVGLALLAGGLYFATQPPVDAVREQLEALRAGQLEGVYEALDDGYREKVTLTEFADFVARHPSLRDYEDSTFWTRSFENRNARISGTLSATTGEEEGATFHLVRRAGAWRITVIEVDGDEAP